jgi:diadenosine tetraphosphatase ApaH/serine/threonine PP2A family protein phosphatase
VGGWAEIGGSEVAAVAGMALVHDEGDGSLSCMAGSGQPAGSGRAFACLADISANDSALAAVLARCAQLGVTRIRIIGNLLKYGPDPAEVCDRILAGGHATTCLAGAFELNLVDDQWVPGYSRFFMETLLRARAHLRPRWWSLPATRARWRWLQNLPVKAIDGDWQFHSGTPWYGPDDVIDLPPNTDGPVCDHFSKHPGGTFIGNLSRPVIIFGDTQEWLRITEAEQTIPVAGRPFIACPGSVGQPRDGDPRAGFAVCDGETITWHRVEYDVKKTMRRMQAQWDHHYAERLEKGV